MIDDYGDNMSTTKRHVEWGVIVAVVFGTLANIAALFSFSMGAEQRMTRMETKLDMIYTHPEFFRPTPKNSIEGASYGERHNEHRNPKRKNRVANL